MGMALGASMRSASCASASPSPAAGVEDAQRLPVPVVVAGGGVNQLREQVNDPLRRGVKPAFRLCCKSHVVSPFSVSSVVSVDGPNRQPLLALGGGT